MSRKWRCGLCRKEITDYDQFRDRVDELRNLRVELDQTGAVYSFVHAETCDDCRRHIALAIMRALTERMEPPQPSMRDVIAEIREKHMELQRLHEERKR